MKIRFLYLVFNLLLTNNLVLYINAFKQSKDFDNLTDSIKESNKLKSRLIELNKKVKDKETHQKIEKLITKIEDAKVEATGELNKRNN